MSLKQETSTIHADTEKVLVSFLKGAGSREAYICLLTAFYGFLKPLEQQLNRVVDEALMPDYADRRKAELLAEDLRALGVNPDEAPVAQKALPLLPDHAAALGALYVFEGSTLGGPSIIRLVKSRSEIPEDAFRFFSSYGPQLPAMWQAFVRHLNDPQHAPSEKRIITAATQTFSAFGTWLKHAFNSCNR